MKRLMMCLVIIMALTMIDGRAVAVPVDFGDGGTSLQGVLDNITMNPNPGSSSVNVLTDAMADICDSYWSIHGSGGSVSTLIIELAQWAGINSFGVYDATNPAKRVQVFGGGASSGAQALLSIYADGSVYVNFMDTGIDFNSNLFGYFLDSAQAPQPWSGGVWYSDTSLNADGKDHMYAYQGKGIDIVQILPFAPGLWDVDETVLAFEDLHAMHWGNQNGINDPFPEWSDTEPDFTDFVVMVGSVDSVPVPFCKEITDGPDLDGDGEIDKVIEVAQPFPTKYEFTIYYNDTDQHEAVVVLDTVPAEWNVISAIAENPDDDVEVLKRGHRRLGATKIIWHPASSSSSLVAAVQSRERGKGDKFAPTSCGPLFLNEGARAFEIDPETGKPKRDPETGEMLPPIHESNTLCLAAVEDVDGDGIILRDGRGDEDGDGLTDLEEVCVLGTDPCNSDTDGDGVPDGDDSAPLDSCIPNPC